MVGFGKLSLIFYGSSDADAMMWAGGRDVYLSRRCTAICGVSVVMTVNRRKLVDNEVVTNLMVIDDKHP